MARTLWHRAVDRTFVLLELLGEAGHRRSFEFMCASLSYKLNEVSSAQQFHKEVLASDQDIDQIIGGCEVYPIIVSTILSLQPS